MQVSFFAPALAPSDPAASSAAGLPSTSTGDKAEAFASVLDARSEGLSKPAGTPKGQPAFGGDEPTDSDEYDYTPDEPAEPEVEEPVAEDAEADWTQRACAAVVALPVVLPLPVPRSASPSIEAAAQGGTDTGAAEDPLAAPTNETAGNWVSLASATAVLPPAAPTHAQSAPTAGKPLQPMADTLARSGTTDSTTPNAVPPEVTPRVVVPAGTEVVARGNEIEVHNGTAANAVQEPNSAAWRAIDQARAAGAEIIVRDAGGAVPGQATTNATGATSGTATPVTGAAAGLLGTAPTLAQMLVETAVSNTPRPPQLGVTTGSETTNPIGETVPSLSGDEGAKALTQANSTFDNVGESAALTTGAAGGPRTDSSAPGGREILASAGGKSGRVARAVAKSGAAQNFQAVEKQRVGLGEPEVGMRTANKTQPMPTNATVLPPADAALEMFELPASPVQATGAASATAAKPLGDVGAARSFAAAAVREVMNAVERTQDTGHAHVELRLQTHDDESLRVHLQWRDGVVHAKFVTQTTEMQRALSSEWDAVAPRMAEKGLKFSEPSFERNGQQPEPQPGQSGFAFNQQQRRPGSQAADADELPDFALPLAKASSVAGAPRRPVSRTSTTDRIVLAEARGLRVWA